MSYWTFDKVHIFGKKVKDVFGENNATIKGNPKVIEGLIGEALEFDGSDDYVNLTNLGDFGSHFNTSSFEAWIKVDKKPDSVSLFYVRDKCMTWGLTINRGIRDELDILNYRIRFKMKNQDNGCISLTAVMGAPNLSDGNWHHIVLTHETVPLNGVNANMSREYNFFYDGKYKSGHKTTLRFMPGFINFENAIYLAANNSNGLANAFFKGAIDEVRIYKRVLTRVDVARNYQSRIGYNVEPTQKLSIIWGSLKSQI